jgi:hypothetical protein
MPSISNMPRNSLLGLLSDGLQGANDFASAPFGYENPPVQKLLNLLGVPAVANTLNRLSYGDSLTRGSGQTLQMLPDTQNSLLSVAPLVGPAAKVGIKATTETAKYLAPAMGDALENYMVKSGGLLSAAPISNTPPLPPYNRFTNGGPMNKNTAHMMFADGDPERVSNYGANHYTFDPQELPQNAVIDSTNPRFIKSFRDALKESGEWNKNEISALLSDASPKNIVDGAGVWDNPDLVQLLWDKVLEPNGWNAVKTPDGAIAFDPAHVKRAPPYHVPDDGNSTFQPVNGLLGQP